MRLSFSLLIFTLTIFSFAHADESIGRIKVDEILLRPTYFSQEREGGDFSFNDSLVSFEWSKDENISAHVAIGSENERGIPAMYLETPDAEQLGFIEAYAQYTGIYGHVRAGLVPLGFGSSGLEKNRERIWPKPIIFEDRLVGERDYGLSFYTENEGYYTEVTVHNGEVDQESDGNLWLTTRWGWANERKFQLQLSGQTGHTNAVMTANGNPDLAGWDNTKNAQWRFVALSTAWRPRNWEVQFQAMLGECEQGTKTNSLNTVQLDVIRNLGRNWGVGLRHDQLDTNAKVHGDQVLQESAMIFNQNDDATSLLSFVYTRRSEEKYQVANDELWVQWRVTPFVK